MAVTSLGFNIFSTYNGSALARARRDLRSTSNNVVMLDRAGRRASRGGMRAMRTAALAAAPALLTLGKGAVGLGAAFGAMAAGAGAAAVVFGGVMAAAARRALQLEAAGKRLNTSQRAFVKSTHALTSAWNAFLDKTSGKTLAPLTIIVNALRAGISRLLPIINAVHPIAMKVARAFARWVVAENGMKRLVATIVRFGVPALGALMMAGRHMLAVLGFAFRALAPLGLSLARALERGALALRRWSEGGGFQRFAAMVRANAPLLRAFFSALGAALRQIAIAMGGLGPLMLIVATAGLRLLASLPIPVIQAIAVAFLLWRVRMIAVRGAMILLGITMAAARAGILGHRAAILADTLASRLHVGATRGSAFAMMFHRAASIGAAIGTRIHAAATRLASLALYFLRVRTLQSFIMMGLYRLRLIFTAAATRLWAAATRFASLAMYFLRLRTLQSFIMMGLYRLRIIFTRLATLAWAATTRIMSLVLYFLRLRVLGAYIMMGLYRLRIIFTRLATIAWTLTTRVAALVMALLRFRVLGAMIMMGLYRLRLVATRLATLAWVAATRIAALVMGLVRLRMLQSAGLMLVMAARMAILRAVTIAWAIATRAYAVAQMLANLAMRLSPIGLLITLIMALVAVIVFLATKTRFFQTIWRAVWGFIKAYAMFVWGVLKAAFRVLMTVLRAIMKIFMAAISGNWSRAWAYIRMYALRVFRLLRIAWNAVKNFFIRVFNVLRRVALAIWRGLWGGIRAAGLAVWRFLRAAWNALKNFFLRVARALWNGLRGAFSAGSKWLRTTFWNPVKNFFTKTIPNAFRAAVRFIGRAWDTLKKIISKPVKAVVDVVYNNGIVKLWNVVAGAFGAKKLGKFNFKGFKSGGYTGNMGKDDVAGVVHGQEYVIPYKQLKAMGGPKAVNKMGPQAAFGLANSEFNNTMAGMSSKNPGKNWTLDPMYKNTLGSVGGRPVGGDGFFDDFFGGIGDFFKKIGGGIKSAFSAVTGFSKGLLSALGALDSCTLPEIVNPIIQKVADTGKGVVNGIIPGAPWLQHLISGGKRAKKGSEGGGLQGAGMIQVAADAIKDWIAGAAECAGCGFADFRPWKAGDGARAGASDRRTMAMLACARKAGFKGSITQGSWSHASASAGTHSGGGALDLSNPSDKNVGALRSCGFAAWNRGAKWGSPSFSPHIHAIAVGNKNLSPGAAAQVRDFKAGKNGLAGGGPDNFKDSGCSGKSGNCNSFKPLAAKALKANGINQNQLGRFMSLMKKESGCKTGAKNNWDSNARAGNASVGLMQVIPTTFRANHCPGTSKNIMDPYANICAAARYIKRRYGGRVPGSPYASGTRSATGGWHMVGERGPEMVRFNGGETVRTASQTRRATGGTATVEIDAKATGGGDVHLHFHGDVYAKSQLEFERMLAGAMQNLKRKGRLPK